MASDGLSQPAKTGRCRICQRVRKTFSKVVPVGEVRHGFATGHIWECADQEDCEKVAREKLKTKDITGVVHNRIEVALERGHYTDYPVFI